LEERSTFMLDTEGGYVHFFKSQDDKKPYQTLSLVGAELTPSPDIDINAEAGVKR